MLRHATKAMQHALPLNLSSFAIFLDLLYDRVYFFCLLKIKPGFSMNKRQGHPTTIFGKISVRKTI